MAKFVRKKNSDHHSSFSSNWQAVNIELREQAVVFIIYVIMLEDENSKGILNKSNVDQ